MAAAILQELSRAVKELQRSFCEQGGATVISETSSDAISLCAQVDAMLRDGLLKKHVDHDEYWPFVSSFSRKEVKQSIKALRHVKTNRGYGRAWIRLALNEASLESYLNMFAHPSDIKAKYYSPDALLYREEEMDLITTLISGLEVLTFSFSLDSPNLDPFKGAGGTVANTGAVARPPAPRSMLQNAPGAVAAPVDSTSISTSLSSAADASLTALPPTGGTVTSSQTPASGAAAVPPVDATVVTVRRHVKTKKKKKSKKESVASAAATANSDVSGDEDATGLVKPAPAAPPPNESVAAAEPASSAHSDVATSSAPDPQPARSTSPVGSPPLHLRQTRNSDSEAHSHHQHGHQHGHTHPHSAHVVYQCPPEETTNAAAATTGPTGTKSGAKTASSGTAVTARQQAEAAAVAKAAAQAAAVAKAEAEAAAARAQAEAEAQALAAAEAEAHHRAEEEARQAAEAAAAERERQAAEAEAHAAASAAALAEAKARHAAEVEERATAEAHAAAAARALAESARRAADLLEEDNSDLYLLVRVQFLKSDHEEILKMTLVAAFDGYFEAPMVAVLTTRAVYLLRPSADAGGHYDLQAVLPYSSLEHITEVHSAQGLNLHYRAAPGARAHSAPLVTGCRAVTAGLETALLDACTRELARQAANGSSSADVNGSSSSVEGEGTSQLSLSSPRKIPDVLRSDSARVAAAMALFDELDATDELRSYHLGYAEASAAAVARQRKAEVALEGRLLVLREKLMTTAWKPYYFVLRWPYIVMMQSAKDAVAKGRVAVDAPDFVCRAVSADDPAAQEQAHAFTCGPRAEPWLLAAESEAERATWLRVLGGPGPPLLGNGSVAVPAVPAGRCWFNISVLLTTSTIYICREDHDLSKLSCWMSYQIEDVGAVRMDGQLACTLEMEAEGSDDDESDDEGSAPVPRLLFRTRDAVSHFLEELNRNWQEIYQVSLTVHR